MDLFFLVLAGAYGLVLGSFLNAVAYRVPRKESLNTRSHCPNCNAKITAIQNVPVLSYLFLRGKCKGCGLPISLRYPAVELSCSACFVLVTWFFGDKLQGELTTSSLALLIVGLCLFAASSIVLAIIDVEHQLLPNRIVYPTLYMLIVTLGAAALISGEPDRFVRGLFGLAALSAFYGLIWFWKPGAMGFGDVRLSMALGFVLAWFSWSVLIAACFLTFFLASIFGLVLVVKNRGGMKTALPFGPWMLLGAWIGLFAGEPLIDMYLQIGGLR